MFGGRVAAKAVGAARGIAQLIPFDVGAADTAANVRRDAAIRTKIDIGVCHQRVCSKRAEIR
ncbi:hypothetical protein D3C86_1963690 [compost metagenome]